MELHPGLDVLHIESGTGYMTALLAAAVGKRGRVSAVDASPLWSKRSRSNVASVHALLAKSIPGGMAGVDMMCANVWSLPRTMRRRYDRIFCGREISSACFKNVISSLLKVGGILVCGMPGSNKVDTLCRVVKLGGQSSEFAKHHIGGGDIDMDSIAPLPKLSHTRPGEMISSSSSSSRREEKESVRIPPDRDRNRLYHTATMMFPPKSETEYDRLLFSKVYDVAIKTLKLKKSLEILHIESGTGYMTVLLAKMIGTGGRVVALDARPEFAKQTRTLVLNTRQESISKKMASVDVMCANVHALPRPARRKYDRIFCERAVRVVFE